MATTTLTFYDEILPGDAAQVLVALDADRHADVEVRINSPGGSVSEGLAIYNALRPRKPTVYIDGVAASIASLIAMSGARIIAAENALMMVHAPWVDTSGNATTLRKSADLLDKHAEAMLTAYMRTGLAHDRLLALLEAETWMNAEEAKALGFIDEINEPLAYAAHAPAAFAHYKNTPETLQMNKTTKAGNGNTDYGDVLAQMRVRNDEIMSVVDAFQGQQVVREAAMAALADPSITIDAFRANVMAKLGREASSCGGYAEPRNPENGRDFIAAASDALAIRAGVKVAKPHPGARDIQGMGMREIMAACASRAGHRLDFGGRNTLATIKAALTTSDFPAILENSLGKALRSGFEAEPSTHEAWTNRVLVPDFKPQTRVLLGSAPDLLEVPEGGEYTHGSMDDDRSVPYAVGKFGRIVQLTWEAIINDDLGAFSRMMQALGQAAARSEADNVYSMFAENSGAGPLMQDGNKLFDSTNHGNVADTSASLTADALGAARVLLRRQKAVGGGALNLTPRYLLVAPEQEQAAETLLAAGARSLAQGTNNELVPPWLATLELVVEARLSGSALYLLTAPMTVDTAEVGWLEADNGPVIVEQDGWSTDSRAYKVRHAFGTRWLDWRGVVKMPLS